MREAPAVSGCVFDFKRMSVNDGPGIRTTVFLKGCPLRCLWCHNPESQKFGKEISATSNNPEPKTLETIRNFNAQPRKQRDLSPACPPTCTSGNTDIEEIGTTFSVQDALEKVLEDRIFFERSGGGVTLSGGEPLAQPEFAIALLRVCHQAGLHTLLDTSGVASENALRGSARFTALYHFDIKETREENHLNYTGVSLQKILDSLELIASLRTPIILRCPIIPGLNDEEPHFHTLGRIAESYQQIQHIELMPYHDIGLIKYHRLGRKAPYDKKIIPHNKTIENWISAVRKRTSKPVREG